MKDRVINDSANRITCPYGWVDGKFHNGVDLGYRSEEWQNEVHPNCAGTVYATLDGVGPGSEYGGGWGNYVLIRHDNGMFSRYAHLQSGLRVSEGQRVDENTVIGIIGESGRAYGRHLHFEVQMNSSSDSRIDPTRYLTDPICDGGSGSEVNIYYRVKTANYGWLSEVRNLDDYAGWNDDPIIDIAMRVDKGSIKYRVHDKDTNRWLSWVTGCNIDDWLNGYAGDDQVIDAVQAYYYTPDDIRPYKKVYYSINDYSYQADTDEGSGMDGYAGIYGVPATKLKMYVE